MNPRLQDKLLYSGDHLSVGKYTYGTPNIIRYPSFGLLTIGAFCSIADGVTIICGGEHKYSDVTTYPMNLLFEEDGWHEHSKGDIAIGNDVWIGYGVTILSGVTIGDGAVIGAGSVVSTHVEPYSIVAGNPIRKIKMRFDNDTIQHLLDSEWWNWDDAKIQQHLPSLIKEQPCLG